MSRNMPNIYENASLYSSPENEKQAPSWNIESIKTEESPYAEDIYPSITVEQQNNLNNNSMEAMNSVDESNSEDENIGCFNLIRVRSDLFTQQSCHEFSPSLPSLLSLLPTEAGDSETESESQTQAEGTSISENVFFHSLSLSRKQNVSKPLSLAVDNTSASNSFQPPNHNNNGYSSNSLFQSLFGSVSSESSCSNSDLSQNIALNSDLSQNIASNSNLSQNIASNSDLSQNIASNSDESQDSIKKNNYGIAFPSSSKETNFNSNPNNVSKSPDLPDLDSDLTEIESPVNLPRRTRGNVQSFENPNNDEQRDNIRQINSPDLFESHSVNQQQNENSFKTSAESGSSQITSVSELSNGTHMDSFSSGYCSEIVRCSEDDTMDLSQIEHVILKPHKNPINSDFATADTPKTAEQLDENFEENTIPFDIENISSDPPPSRQTFHLLTSTDTSSVEIPEYLFETSLESNRGQSAQMSDEDDTSNASRQQSEIFDENAVYPETENSRSDLSQPRQALYLPKTIANTSGVKKPKENIKNGTFLSNNEKIRKTIKRRADYQNVGSLSKQSRPYIQAAKHPKETAPENLILIHFQICNLTLKRPEVVRQILALEGVTLYEKMIFIQVLSDTSEDNCTDTE